MYAQLRTARFRKLGYGLRSSYQSVYRSRFDPWGAWLFRFLQIWNISIFGTRFLQNSDKIESKEIKWNFICNESDSRTILWRTRSTEVHVGCEGSKCFKWAGKRSNSILLFLWFFSDLHNLKKIVVYGCASPGPTPVLYSFSCFRRRGCCVRFNYWSF